MIKIENKQAILSINPKIYSLEVIYSAAYVFLDKAYIMLDGDPETEIIVKIKSKTEQDLEELGGEFFNELLNYSDYNNRAKQTKAIREMILQRALFANDSALVEDNEFEELLKELEEDDNIEDIAVPWEEKYGKDNIQ